MLSTYASAIQQIIFVYIFYKFDRMIKSYNTAVFISASI